MDENDLKRYTVILGEGSGVLFQPLDETKTYVLSAKHVFYDEDDTDGRQTNYIFKQKIILFYSTAQDKPVEIEISKDINYFEHPDVDAAILILNENLGFDQIFVDEKTTGFEGFSLTGYPNSKRKTDDKYEKLLVSDINSYNENLIALRLVVSHLDHEQITGFSGGGIIKTNGDSLLLAGIQSKTPIGNCNGEINAIPIKRFEEIIEENNLPKLLPSYLSNISTLMETIICFDETSHTLRPKLKKAISTQFSKVKCELKNIFNTSYINKSSISNTGKKSKYFWTSFLEYALIISLIEDTVVDEEVLTRLSQEKKFIFSDSSKDIYTMYEEILLFASENINDQCQVLVGTIKTPKTTKTRRMSAQKVPNNIANVDDLENIDRVIVRHKIKEIIHLKAIELDCINENDALLDVFEIHQFEDILTEIKRLVYEFFHT